MQGTSERHEKVGIVVLFDALGARNQSIPEADRFIRTLNDALAEVKATKDSRDAIPPVVRTFGDSVLMTWELTHNGQAHHLLWSVIVTCGQFMASCLEQRFLFRGAMGYGFYIEDELTILGPAVADAASWYEKSEWIGCIGTPRFFHWVNSQLLQEQGWQWDQLVLYPVPLKDNKILTTWCIDWGTWLTHPGYVPIRDQLRDAKMRRFNEILSGLDIPSGTEQKYRNTERFLIQTLYNNYEALNGCSASTIRSRIYHAPPPDYDNSD